MERKSVKKKVTTGMVLTVLLFGTMALGLSVQSVDAIDPYENLYGDTINLSQPGPSFNERFLSLRGDNITITIWNYQGPQHRHFKLHFSSLYCEKDENFTDMLEYETLMTKGRTIVLWIIVYQDSFGVNADFPGNDNTPVSVNIKVTREPSSYSPYYEYSEHIEKQTEELRENITVLQEQNNALVGSLENLTRYIDRLNDTIDGYNRTQQQILENISGLWEINDMFNNTLVNLARDFEDLNFTEPNMSWIEENLTIIKTNLFDVRVMIDQIPTYDDDLLEMRNLIDATIRDLDLLNRSLSNLQDAMPDEYDDTDLLDRIALLESWNDLLRSEIDILKKNQDEPSEELLNETGKGLVYFAIVMGSIGVILGAFPLMKKKNKRV